MHSYIPHLIEDIKAAHRVEIPEKENTPQTLEEHFEEIEAWVRGDEPEHTFGYHCGLKSENFPPPEQLKEKEMKLKLRWKIIVRNLSQGRINHKKMRMMVFPDKNGLSAFKKSATISY